MHDFILTSCLLRKKFLRLVRNLRGSVVRAAVTLHIFLLAWVQSPPRCTCNFFFLPGFNPHPGIHVKGDRYCIFAFLQDTNHVCIPLGEQSTKKFTQKVTFTYSANYCGLYYGDNRQLATSIPFGN